MSIARLFCLFVFLLPSLRASAQGGDPLDGDEATSDPTDPTEPVASPALVTLPGGTGTEDSEETSIPGDPWGDTGSEGLLSLRALFQARYVGTLAAARSVSGRESYRVREDYLIRQGDGYGLHRVFLRIGSDPSRYVGFKAILDFAELIDGDPEDVVKQAYATLRAVPEHLELVVGLFKLPYSTLELDASSRFELAHFGEADQLIGQLGFGGKDLGVQVLAAPLRKAKRLRLSLGAFRGNAKDEHASPIGALAARIETKPNKHLRFGADFVRHMKAVTYDRPFNTSDKDELPSPPDPLYPAQKRLDRGQALSVDARYKQKGFMLRGELLYGDRVDVDERYGARTFWAAWGLVAYRIDLGALRLLPAVRYEWLDADREHAGGEHSQISAGLTALFWERVRLLVDVTRIDVHANTPLLNQPKPLQLEPYLALDTTRLTVQLQLEL